MNIPTANQKDPFAFFDFILSNKHGISSLKKEFVPSQEDFEYYGNKLSYNVSTEEKTLVTFNNISGEEEIEVYKFSDFLYQRSKEEYSKCISAIDIEILGIQDKGRIEEYLNVIFARLNYLRNSIKIFSDTFIKYPELNKFPCALESLLKEKYTHYTTDESQHVGSGNKAMHSIPPKIPVIKINPGVFKWAKGDSDKLNSALHEFLLSEGFINCSIEQLSMAFSGNENSEPLKIKWLDLAKNSHTNKVTLLYLFQLLSEHRFIDTEFEPKDLNNKLTHIFVDKNGHAIRYINQSKSNLRKPVLKNDNKTRSKRLIDKFMLTFCTLLPKETSLSK